MPITKTEIFGSPRKALNVVAVDGNMYVSSEASRIRITLAHLEKYGHPSHDSIVHFGHRQRRMNASH
jgi:hypothetical protein